MTAKQHTLQPTTEYYDWRRKVGEKCYVSDVDQVEWRYIDDELIAVAVIELTQARLAPADHRVMDIVLERYDTGKSKMQGQAMLYLSRALLVDSYIVIWQTGLQVFWVYNYTQRIGWRLMDQDAYTNWLKGKGR